MTKYCPICGAKIEDWETVCNTCWQLLGKIDKNTGSDIQKQISMGKRIIFVPRIVKVYVPIYYPLSERKKSANIHKLFRAFCSKCKRTDCDDCLIHKVMNSVLYGYDDGEEIVREA